MEEARNGGHDSWHRAARLSLPLMPRAVAGRRALRLRGVLRPDRARVRPRFARRRDAPRRDRARTALPLAIRAAAPGRRAPVPLRGRMDATPRDAAPRRGDRRVAAPREGPPAPPTP